MTIETHQNTIHLLRGCTSINKCHGFASCQVSNFLVSTVQFISAKLLKSAEGDQDSMASSCHGRFCNTNLGYYPTATQCMNLSSFISQNFDSDYQTTYVGCCKIYCNTSNALDALQCQGASASEAISIWICLMSVLILAFLHLLGGIWPGLSLKLRITTMGSLALKMGLTSYFLVIFSGQSLDTILYPIVTAMDFAILSYFFSGFQYAIGIGTEAAAVVLLSFTIFPLYHILVMPEAVVPYLVDDYKDSKAYAIRGEALAMLSLALVWALHSAVYRTISYRAHWIAAWKKQTAPDSPENCTIRKHHMSRLWFLAAGQGNPTWHTSVGRSVGLVMLILAWIIVVQCRHFLKQNCTDDFILFQIMLYVPPVLLTLAMLSTELHLLRFAGFDLMTTGGKCKCHRLRFTAGDFPCRSLAHQILHNSGWEVLPCTQVVDPPHNMVIY